MQIQSYVRTELAKLRFRPIMSQIDNDPTVAGTTTLSNLVINGNTNITGNSTQTGNITITGNATITQDLFVNPSCTI